MQYYDDYDKIAHCNLLLFGRKWAELRNMVGVRVTTKYGSVWNLLQWLEKNTFKGSVIGFIWNLNSNILKKKVTNLTSRLGRSRMVWHVSLSSRRIQDGFFLFLFYIFFLRKTNTKLIISKPRKCTKEDYYNRY